MFSAHDINPDTDDVCPECSQSWRGAPMAAKYAVSYCDSVQYYTRLVGVQIWYVYDGVCYWVCPDCNARFHRFAEGDERRGNVEYALLDSDSWP